MTSTVTEIHRRFAGHDYGYEAQQAAEAHLDLCNEWEEWEENGGEEGSLEAPKGENPAVGPYCGCITCTIREILHAAWPILEAGVRSGDFDEIPAWGPDCHTCTDYRVQMVPSGGDYVCPRCGSCIGCSPGD